MLDEAQLEHRLDSDARVFRFEFGKRRRHTGVTGRRAVRVRQDATSEVEVNVE